MKKLITIFLFFCWQSITFAQNPEMLDKIEAAKIGIITQKLNLSAEQSKTFWVIYNQYSAEKKAIRQELTKLFNNSRTATDDQLVKNMEKMLELRDKEADIDRKYYKEFQKAISVRQIFELYKAEIQFKAFLVDKILKRGGKRKGNKGGGEDEDFGEGLD